ncbi:MAG TPA: hypothetical protein DCS11_09235 [Syntrophus sp. (in: bacteria)]|nr:hypothetical protein [Syntrophus sp. (in: bacteria)]
MAGLAFRPRASITSPVKTSGGAAGAAGDGAAGSGGAATGGAAGAAGSGAAGFFCISRGMITWEKPPASGIRSVTSTVPSER